MRSTSIKGVEDDIRYDLGSSTALVVAVQKVGIAKDYLVFEACLTGEEVLRLMAEAGRPDIFEEGEIIADHHYILTAFDD